MVVLYARDYSCVHTYVCLYVCGVNAHMHAYQVRVVAFIYLGFDPTIGLPRWLGGSVVRASVLASRVSWVRILPEQRFFSLRRKKSCLG